MSTPPRLVLASASPRRHELLAGLGLSFSVQPAEIDETPRENEPPREYVLRCATEKAAAITTSSQNDVILAADTIVEIDGVILGKPRSRADAERMLRRLARRRHRVLTAVAVRTPSGSVLSDVEITEVLIRPLTDPEISWYLATGEPDDKAGAYAIQGFFALFVEGIDGNYSNVVGLPLPLVYRLLGEAGLDVLVSTQR